MPIPIIGNNNASKIVLGFIKNGVTTPALNQAAATVLENSDKDFRCDLLNDNPFIAYTYSNIKKFASNS